jgi:hypothetical protein
MQGKDVPVPSFIMDIYRDYDSEWNQNKVRNIAPAKESLQALRSTPVMEPVKEVKVSGNVPP